MTGTTGRLDRLRAVIAERNLDGIMITDPWNRHYLSGYTAEDDAPDESAGIALIGSDIAAMFVSPNNTEWAASEAPSFTVSGLRRPWTKGLAEQIVEYGWKRVGFEDHSITFATHRDLVAALDGKADLIALDGAVTALRAVKDADELRLLERAIAITDQVFTEVAATLRPGMTEREVAWRIEDAYRPAGADGIGFQTIVASGPHAARPHHNPGDRELREGEPIIIDMGAKVGGYTGDLTRTVWLGEPSEQLRTIYRIVADANAAALAGLRAGVTEQAGDALARDVIAAAGYGDQFAHGLGHGVGLRVHEAPSLSRVSKGSLVAGSLVTVEPGIYIPDWGGVRIEDIVLIEDNGARVLTHAPKMTP